jgi:hypothetical protein
MNTLTNVWSNVVKLLDDGYSVIPIRDKDEVFNGKTYTRKSPYARWEKHQTAPATKEELYFMLEKFNTLAIATICGKVSGNLEGIDVDSKWMPSVVKPLFEAIKHSFPDIKFRIIRTPSKGYHIVYRVNDGVIPPNKKLASRNSTEEELKENPKGKIKCFIESRGEGGYLAAFPTDGYEVLQDVPPPVITWEQRCNLIAICESFNQVVKQDVYKPTKQESIYYSENPFEHFNKSQEAEHVLLNNGWKFHSRNSIAIYFTRPGSKSGGIHAAFLLDTSLYKFFTSNSEFENEGRLYNAASVKAILEFGGDKKRLFPALVAAGYGRIRQNKEKELVKTIAINGGELPANISENAKESLTKLKESIQAEMPYGIFWEYNEKGAIEINRLSLSGIAQALGFRNYRENVVQIEGKFIYERTSRYFYDTIINYVKLEPEEYELVYNAWDVFVERHGKHAIERLPLLDENSLLKDTRIVCYKFYENGFVKVEKNKSELLDYKDLTGLVFYSKIQKRNFQFGNIAGKYLEFLQLACRYNENTEYINKIIGYLSHEYKDSTTGYIIVQVEECPDPKNGGGSGKNLFVSLLGYTTSYCSKPGDQVKFDERFLQAWNGERLFNVSDVPEKFTFSFLKELSTGDAILKKLFKDELIIKCADMCKFIISTNYSYETKDGGLKRRIIPIEFTDFFTKEGGINKYFGANFPDCWNEEDWIGYDNLIIQSVQQWLFSNLDIQPKGLSEGGIQKQFELMYGEITRQFFQQMWPIWSTLQDYFISNTSFKDQYDAFFKENELNDKYKISPQRMNKALNDWSKDNGYDYVPDQQGWERVEGNPYGAKNQKGRKFIPKEPPF